MGARSQGGRKTQMDALKVGESVVFVGQPGGTVHKMMTSIASCYRGSENIRNQGLTQAGGMAGFDGELMRPAVKVTRLAEPTNVDAPVVDC